MVLRHRERQGHDQIIDVADWYVDSEFLTLEGAQPKRVLFAPEQERAPFLLPGHKYLFKMPGGWQVRQIWSEIIAYELSRLVSLDVPPSFLAVDSRTGDVGVLIEFFYGHKGEAPVSLISGSDHIRERTPSFDQKKGRPHEVPLNLLITRALGVDSPKEWWAKAFLFDALIGNTDRHPYNWGFLAQKMPDGGEAYRMAPLFDNGTSLSYGDPDEKLSLIKNLDTYINRGRHHCTWESSEQKGVPHLELCRDFLRIYKLAGFLKEFVIRFQDEELADILDWCRAFESPVEFSEVRSNFILRVLRRRRDILLAMCE